MPETAATESHGREAALGAMAAGAGYSLWGLSIIFYKQLASVPPFEILAHRSIWSVALIAALIFGMRRSARLKALIASRRTFRTLVLTALIIGSNWFVFIYAVNTDRVLETSLGYFINPLVSVLAGVVLLGERLSRPQVLAMALAALGVGYFTFALGFVPWISLYLAMSFAAYGYLRKITRVEALEGLFIEVAALAPVSLFYLAWMAGHGGTGFGRDGWYTDLFLVLTGPMTTVPLLLFTYGAQRIRLTTLGLMQYLVPTMSFAIAVWLYGEPLGHGQLVTFACIWTGLAIFSVDTWRKERELRRAAV
jgi:chloramphenicol-sensitive protein RarD